MRHHFSQSMIVLAFLTTTIATPSASGDTPYDPDAYSCREELRDSEHGTLQAYVFANKRSEGLSFEGEWYSSLKAPRVRAHWGGSAFSRDRNLNRGRILLYYNDINPENGVRMRVGSCSGNQNSCGRGWDQTTDFKQNRGYASISTDWGAIVSMGRIDGNLYVQIQDEAGTVLREDQLPVATLLAVEKEMRRLIESVSEKQARLKDKCMERSPLNTPPH